MTAAVEILARHSDRKSVYPGDTLFLKADLAVGSEIIFPQMLKYLRDLGINPAESFNGAALINGHLIPTKEAAVGTLVAALDRFAAEHDISSYSQAGRSGPCQNLLADYGLSQPGDFVIGKSPGWMSP